MVCLKKNNEQIFPKFETHYGKSFFLVKISAIIILEVFEAQFCTIDECFASMITQTFRNIILTEKYSFEINRLIF